ncbi:MAG: ATP-dependent RNA helicase DeaD, partial [Francisellaceae bacterium]
TSDKVTSDKVIPDKVISDNITFDQLGLSDNVLSVVNSLGYEKPSPIQEEIIPFMLEGRDVLGQAQTGTGKTAAFALPLLTNIDVKSKKPQVLVLAPTRELAIQVAEAFQKYASNIKGFQVLPIYGGQDYSPQLRQLKRGVSVVVGTPGRVMDHMRKGSLVLDELKTLVLDEADEMLRMGFIDDIEWVLEHVPSDAQKALFSATMPNDIRRIAKRYLKNPEEITIKSKTATASTVAQRFWMVSGVSKLEALTRILEVEKSDGILIFVRTKTSTVELSEKLQARGFASTPLNGDISQNLRERTINNLKSGKIDIVVATDVAARGIDVSRVTHVINYDIPYDTEAYVHRIGRTGRAGRAGDAILFVVPREKRLLFQIEKVTKQKITQMKLPSAKDINLIRVENFKEKISETIQSEDLSFYKDLISNYQENSELDIVDVAAALAKLMQGDNPLLLNEKQDRATYREESRTFDNHDSARRGSRNRDGGRGSDRDSGRGSDRYSRPTDANMESYRVAVGRQDGVQPGNLVGAIANEIKLDSKFIGRINIFDSYTTVDLPTGMPKESIDHLKRVRVAGKKLDISKARDK